MMRVYHATTIYLDMELVSLDMKIGITENQRITAAINVKTDLIDTE